MYLNYETKPLLQVSIPTKRIKDDFYLKNIEFQVPAGYMVGMIGKNGAGKTSLIRLLLGAYYLDSGNIWVDGYSMLNQAKIAKSKVGFVLDENPFPPSLTVQECGKVCGIFYEKFSMKKFTEECVRFQLPPKRKIQKLSQGMQIKFQLAFALAADVRLLVMDEPTAGLDPVFRHEFMDVLCDFIEDGRQGFFLEKEQLGDCYKLVTGTQNQLMCIPKDRLIAKELSQNHSEALIYANGSPILIALQELPLTTDKLMYYLARRGEEDMR